MWVSLWMFQPNSAPKVISFLQLVMFMGLMGVQLVVTLWAVVKRKVEKLSRSIADLIAHHMFDEMSANTNCKAAIAMYGLYLCLRRVDFPFCL